MVSSGTWRSKAAQTPAACFSEAVFGGDGKGFITMDMRCFLLYTYTENKGNEVAPPTALSTEEWRS